MYDRILLPVDETAVESSLLYHVGEIATWADATVELLYVADTSRDSVTVADGDVVDALVEAGQEVVAEAGRLLDSLDVDYTTRVEQGTPARTIVDYATRESHDVIAMPTHGREGLSRYLLGSVTEKVVRLAPAPVLTAPLEDAAFDFPYEALVVPTDGSDTAQRAAEHALDLAAALDAAVHVLSVTEESLLTDAEDGAADEAVSDVVAAAETRGVDDVTTQVETGDPDTEILAAVDRVGADAVVLGATGRHGIDRVLLGGTAEKVVRSADVPVITIGDD